MNDEEASNALKNRFLAELSQLKKNNFLFFLHGVETVPEGKHTLEIGMKQKDWKNISCS